MVTDRMVMDIPRRIGMELRLRKLPPVLLSSYETSLSALFGIGFTVKKSTFGSILWVEKATKNKKIDGEPGKT